MAKLVIQQLSKVFDRTTAALDQVTLDVADGEVWGVVGPSGSGKTTLLRLVAGLEEPTTGRIVIGDRCVNTVPPHRRDVAMVFQNYPLYPHMTVRQNLAFPLKRLKVPKAGIAERMEQIIAWLEIHDLQDRMPVALSGGQRQRVALGKALIRRPSVLLLDEPLSSVDAPLRDRLRRHLREILSQAETTCLYVTHDQAEAMAVADRICVLQAGKIQQIGTAHQVYERPANRFVAGFFGTPAMNFTEAIVQSDRDALSLHLSGGEPLVLPALKRSGVSYTGQVVIGIRPQDLMIVPVEKVPVHGLIGTVTSVEFLGSRTDVCVVDRAGRTWIVTGPGRVKARTQDPVALTLDVNKVHLFEPGPQGRNLGGGSS